MNLWVARHGQTVWNLDGRVCGLTDVALTEQGMEQARVLGLNAREHCIDFILASPLQRAMVTAQIVSEQCGGIPVIAEPRLLEQNYGIFEGVKGKDEHFLENKRQFAYRYPGGESMMQVAARVYPLLDELKEQYGKDDVGKNILLITHGGVCRVIRSYFVDMSNEEYFRYVQKNCAIERYSY